MELSKLDFNQIVESEIQICKNINFINEENIKEYNWLIAEELIKDIDIKDISYIAFVNEFHSKLWSGDKKLIKGLLKKQFNNIITTDELWNLKNFKLKIHDMN